MSAQRIIIVKKTVCNHPDCGDTLAREQLREREEKRRAEAAKIKRELLTLARRVEELEKDDLKSE